MQPRKCQGKSKHDTCLQGADHPNTRWECSFETLTKEDLQKHAKNIMKRTKWRELVDSVKPDKDGIFRCVYFSSDRHHVENHYLKGQEITSPGSPNLRSYKAPYTGPIPINGKNKNGKRVSWPFDSRTPEGLMDGSISPELAAREMKRMKQDASLLGLFQENQATEADKENEEKGLQDSIKTEDLIKSIETRLEIPHDLCQQAMEKLHKQGFMIVYGLKNLKKEGWERLGLPMAIEQELKSLIGASKRNSFSYAPYWTGNQSIFYPFPPYDDDGSDEEMEKDKEKVDVDDPTKKDGIHSETVASAMAAKVLADKEVHIPLVQPTEVKEK